MSDFDFLTVDELEVRVRELLSAEAVGMHFGKYGEPTWRTNSNNLDAFSRRRLRPRVLSGVTDPVLATTVLGSELSMPIMVAPSGGHQRFHPEGELATVRGAAAAGTAMGLSTVSNFTIEEVATAGPTVPLWFQLYPVGSRYITEQLISRAEDAGYRALVVTVDNLVRLRTQSPRARRYGLTSFFDLTWPDLEPDRLIANFVDYVGTPEMPSGRIDEMGLASMSWADVERLRSQTSLPIVVKGVQTFEDAAIAVERGVDAVIVSTHGGVPHGLDGVSGTLDVLPEVVQAVDNRIEVYLDSGVRHGDDVLKALALGARAVLVGRAPLWGLIAGGADGVAGVLGLLADQLADAMCLTGVASVADVPSSVVTEHHVDGRNRG